MNTQRNKPKPGEMVVLTKLPPGFLDDLPKEDQLAISSVVGKAVVLKGYDKDGRAELEFEEEDGTTHLIYVNPVFLKSAK